MTEPTRPMGKPRHRTRSHRVVGLAGLMVIGAGGSVGIALGLGASTVSAATPYDGQATLSIYAKSATQPEAVAIDKFGDVFFSTFAGPQSLQELTAAQLQSEESTSPAGPTPTPTVISSNLASPYGIAVYTTANAEYVFVSNLYSIAEFKATVSGSTLGSFSSVATLGYTGESGPSPLEYAGLTIDPATGNLYAADPTDGNVDEFAYSSSTSTWGSKTIAASGLASSNYGDYNITFTGGNLYVDNTSFGDIVEVAGGNGAKTTVFTGLGSEALGGITSDAAGDLFVVNNASSTPNSSTLGDVLELPATSSPTATRSSETLPFTFPNSTTLNSKIPDGITVDSAGDLYMADNPDSAVLELAPPPATPVVTATSAPAAVDLSWTESQPPLGLPITSYTINYAVQGQGGTIKTITEPAGTTTADITGLTPGTNYLFNVFANTNAGQSSSSGVENVYQTAGATSAPVPLAPVLSPHSPLTDTYGASWPQPTNTTGSPVTGYNWWESCDGGASYTPEGVDVATLPATVTLPPGETCFVVDQAINAVGPSATTSPESNSVTTPTVPNAPMNPSITTTNPANGTVTFTWTNPTGSGTGGSPLTGDNVYETCNGGNATLVSSGTIITSYSTSVGTGQDCSFYAEAVNAVGPSVGSSPVSTTTPTVPTAPGAPVLTGETPLTDTYNVTWPSPTSTGGSPITGYNWWETCDNGQTFTQEGFDVSTLPTTVALVAGGTCWVVDQAVNAVGPSPQSHPSNIVNPPTAPGAPGPDVITFTPRTGPVEVSWTPGSNGGSTPVTYTVTETCGVTTTTIYTGTGTSTSTTIAAPGTTCTFSTTATNPVGTSPPSTPTSYTAPTVPGLTTPITLSITPGIESADLTWTAPDDGGSPLLSYEIFEGTSPGGEASTPVATVGPTTLTDTISSLTPGTTYYFTVEATNAVGNSAPSNEVSATPSAPAAPVTPTTTTTPATTTTAAPAASSSTTSSSTTSSSSSTAAAAPTVSTKTTLSSPIFTGRGKPGATTFRFVATYTAHITTTGGADVTGGTVTFTNDGHVMCKSTVKDGIALCTSRLATKAATLIIGAKYNPLSGYGASKVNVSLKVFRAPDQVQLTRKKTLSGLYRYTADIRPVTKIGGAGVPRGSVTFSDSEGAICSARLHNEIASCISHVDPKSYTAVYHPGKDFEPTVVHGHHVKAKTVKAKAVKAKSNKH